MSDEIARIVTGYDAVIPIQLTKSGQAFNIDSGASVKAALISTDRNTVFISAVTVNSNEQGSDWSTSLIIPKFTAAQTSELNEFDDALIEISVDDGGVRIPFFSEALIVKGNIS